MRNEFVKTGNEILGLPLDGRMDIQSCNEETIIGFMVCRRLDRIAADLETIASSLQSIEQRGITTFIVN